MSIFDWRLSIRGAGCKAQGAKEAGVSMRPGGPRLRFFVGWGEGRGYFVVVFVDPAGAGCPVRGVALPVVVALFEPLPISPAEEGEIEIAPGEAADFAHDRGAFALALFELVGEEDDLGDERHFGGAEGVVADGGKGLVIGDPEAFAEDGGGDGAVEEDWFGAVCIEDRDASLGGEAELFSGREGAEEVVAPGGEGDAVGVEVVAVGEVEGFDEDAFDVEAEAFGAGGEFGEDGGDLVGNQPSPPAPSPGTGEGIVVGSEILPGWTRRGGDALRVPAGRGTGGAA